MAPYQLKRPTGLSPHHWAALKFCIGEPLEAPNASQHTQDFPSSGGSTIIFRRDRNTQSSTTNCTCRSHKYSCNFPKQPIWSMTPRVPAHSSVAHKPWHTARKRVKVAGLHVQLAACMHLVSCNYNLYCVLQPAIPHRWDLLLQARPSVKLENKDTKRTAEQMHIEGPTDLPPSDTILRSTELQDHIGEQSCSPV